MSYHYYDQLCEFINFLKIQDDSTLMYKSGNKLIDLCKMTKSMAMIEEDAAQMQREAEDNVLDEEVGLGLP